MRYFIYKAEIVSRTILWNLTHTLDSEDELIAFLSCYQKGKPETISCSKCCWIDYRNKYLDYINLTGQDTYAVYESSYPNNHFVSTRKEYIRPYLILDSYGNPVDTRKYADKLTVNPYSWLTYGKMLRMKNRKHRQPGSWHSHKSIELRHTKYRHLYFDHTDPDYPAFNGKDPRAYHKWSRETCGCWKDQSKKRRQWESNQKHLDTAKETRPWEIPLSEEMM